MKKFLAAAIATVFGSAASAQTADTVFLQSIAVCDTPEIMTTFMDITEQSVLFHMESTVTFAVSSSDVESVPGVVSFWVNQDTGNATVLWTDLQGIFSCMLSTGNSFEPYVD